jgi:2-keto-4-pentenoate hydratase
LTQDSAAFEQAARHLVSARRNGHSIDRLPAKFRPETVEEGLAIQNRVSRLIADSIGGWKAGLPGQGTIIVGPIYEETIFRSSPCRVRGGTARVEPEIGFVLSQDLPPRDTDFTEAEVLYAVAETRLALELVGCRYTDPGKASFPELLADGLSNAGLFVGPATGRKPADLPGAFQIAVEGKDGTRRYEGRHRDGRPVLPLCWLANFLRKRGEALRAGQIIITGSYAGVLELPLGEPLRLQFGDLGVMSVEFAKEGDAR